MLAGNYIPDRHMCRPTLQLGAMKGDQVIRIILVRLTLQAFSYNDSGGKCLGDLAQVIGNR